MKERGVFAEATVLFLKWLLVVVVASGLVALAVKYVPFEVWVGVLLTAALVFMWLAAVGIVAQRRKREGR